MNQLPEAMHTPRTQLRRFQFRDVGDVFSYASDPEWSRYLPVPWPYSMETARQFVASQTLQDHATHPSWAVEVAGTVIGGINIRFQFDYRIGEMGYSIARSHWGQGFATEVAGTVMDEAFTVFADLHKVRAMADARNIGSQRVMERLGMKREGVLRQNRFSRGEFVDEVWYGLLRKEWESRQRESGC